jgi:hypothetical protein
LILISIPVPCSGAGLRVLLAAPFYPAAENKIPYAYIAFFFAALGWPAMPMSSIASALKLQGPFVLLVVLAAGALLVRCCMEGPSCWQPPPPGLRFLAELSPRLKDLRKPQKATHPPTR